MMKGASGGRFLVGGIAGLALALVLVGAGSLVPQAHAPQTTISAAPAAEVTSSAACSTCASLGSGSAGGQTTSANSVPAEAPAATFAGAAVAPPGATTTTSAELAMAAGSVPASYGEPATILSALPGESAGSIVADLTPLIIGLLVAVLVYGAYSRRQDA